MRLRKTTLLPAAYELNEPTGFSEQEVGAKAQTQTHPAEGEGDPRWKTYITEYVHVIKQHLTVKYEETNRKQV